MSRHDDRFVGFSGMFLFGRSELLYRDFDKVSDGLDLSKSGCHSNERKKMLSKVSVRN